MAVECTPEALSEAAACFNAGYGPLILKAIRIRLLCAILNGETIDCDVETLASEATCFVEALELGQMDAIETYLLCQLANV